MFNHAPSNYPCPICNLVKGIESEYNSLSDIVLRSDRVLAFIPPKWWPNNPGHVMVVPIDHYENLYDILQPNLHTHIDAVQVIARTLKGAYHCDGVSTRQHNEPAGNQDLWHFHTHIFPRWTNNKLYLSHDESIFVSQTERAPYAAKLRDYLNKLPG